MTVDEAIVRVSYKYEGGANVRQATKDVDRLERGSEKLNVALAAAGAGFLAFSKRAVNSFGEIESAMARFASRAGWSLRRFTKETAQATHDIARLTGVKHTLIIQAVQEGISQGGLLGMKTPEILDLVREGSKLHAAGQTNLLQAVSSAITSRQYGAPSAPFGQRLIYSASQVGAGNPAEYGKEYKDIAPGGNILNIEQSESLGALALIAGAAPSLAEGATWIKALYRTMSNPMQDAENMFKERMGYDWSQLIGMLPERGGLNKVLQILATNFSGVEHMEMFGRQEAVQGLTALTVVPGQLLRLQNAVRKNAIDDPVARAWSDNIDTWHVNMKRFQRSMDTFLRSFGQPIVWVLNRLVDVMRHLLDGLTWFNETFRGIPGILVSLVASLLTLRFAMNAFAAATPLLSRIFTTGPGGLGGLIGYRPPGSEADRRAREDERDARDRANRRNNTIGETAGVLAGDYILGRTLRGDKDASRVAEAVKNKWSGFVNFTRARAYERDKKYKEGRSPLHDIYERWWAGESESRLWDEFTTPLGGAAHSARARQNYEDKARQRRTQGYTSLGEWAPWWGPDWNRAHQRRFATGYGPAGFVDPFDTDFRKGWRKRKQWSKGDTGRRGFWQVWLGGVKDDFSNKFWAPIWASLKKQGTRAWGKMLKDWANPFGVLKSTLYSAILLGMIGGFKWFWNKTADTEYARYAYALAGQRSAFTRHLAGGGTMSTAPVMGDIDLQNLRTNLARQTLDANSALFWESFDRALGDLVFDKTRHHGFWAEFRADSELAHSKADESKVQFWATIFNGLNAIFADDSDVQTQINKDLNDLNTSLKRTADLRRGEVDLLRLDAVEASQSYADMHDLVATLRGGSLSPQQKAKHMADMIGSLPVYDPREMHSYMGAQLDKDGNPIGSAGYRFYPTARGGLGLVSQFDQSLSGNAPVTININVDRATGSPAEIADAVQDAWRSIGNSSDGKTF